MKGLDLTSAESLQVNYDKLCGTILERYTLSVRNDDQVPVRNENAEFVMQMEEQMNEAGNVDVELENTEARFDCWKLDSPYGGHVDSEPPHRVLEGVSNVVQQKKKRSDRGIALEDCMPNLFPNLLELSSTAAADGDGCSERSEADLTNAWLKNKELEDVNRRKSLQINELEARVDVMERIIGKKAFNLFIGAVIWDGGDNGMRVYFSDIQALVQQSCVSGKVIDAYAAILTVLQWNCADKDNNVDSCYFFSSICAKQWVVKYHNRIVGVGARTTSVAPPYIDGTLESVMDCPQQAVDTVDCVMIVCFLMRQYVQKIDINTTMDGVTTTAYRALMTIVAIRQLVVLLDICGAWAVVTCLQYPHSNNTGRNVTRGMRNVLVVANPANTNALFPKEFAPSISEKNITCLIRLDHERALGQVSERLNVPVSNVKNVNHSSTEYPDVNHATIKTPAGEKPVRELVANDEWLHGEFITTIQQRGAAIIKARKLSSALSAASSACDHIPDWVLRTPEGTWVSMGVYSDGSYNVPAGLIYSFLLLVAMEYGQLFKVSCFCVLLEETATVLNNAIVM
ncbi:Malate dehydrogenase 2, cytoplasmic [Camellia lanceoleosa]|uniref:Malate dehydrogenase 2, cytoplasmic n=1 Tax=Camellia lanceoleosa TaxID=1840588 RepID=A0ACC0GQM1_9ERIC|nr:Malate dehydrogenase 2, cytoplasmic [Camellia lanceoleosa]